MKRFKKTLRNIFFKPLETLVACIAFFVIHLLGQKGSSNFGGWVARTFGPLVSRPNSVARKNLHMAFPEKSSEEIERIIKGVWDNMGRIIPEYVYFESMNIHDTDLFKIVGQEHIQALIDHQKPAILFSGHLANWGIVSVVTHRLGLPITQIYRRFNNPITDWMINSFQRKSGIKTLWKGAEGGKEAYKCLKQGGHLVLFVDQKLNEGIPIPFFGRVAMTAPAPARLGLKLNCPIVPVRVERIEAVKFKVTYYSPLTVDTSQDLHKNVENLTLQMNQILETWIRERPEQWLWVHNRWPKRQTVFRSRV